MKIPLNIPLFVSTLIATLPAFGATTVVDLTGLPSDRANFNLSNTGQTFTTGLLGMDTLLASVGLEGPRDNAQSDNLAIQIWTDTDGNQGTWDPGVLLGTSTNSAQLAINTVSLFNFSGVTLSDNTVYTLRILSDDANKDNFVRFGLVGGGNLYKNGTLFNGGSIPFNNGYDASISVTTTTRTVPSGGSTALMMGAGFFALLGVKRKLR